MDYSSLKLQFIERFNTHPRIFRSPGRINIIGEHTDYNEGFVLPAAVDKEICLLISPSDSEYFSIYSKDQNEVVQFTLANYKEVETTWARYLIGVIDELVKKGFSIKPVNILFSGDIPLGAGMSSSAALECATVLALDSLFDLALDRWDRVKIAQAAENNFVGVKCGIMDQFASVFSEKDSALRLDCRTLEFTRHPFTSQSHSFILVDSMVKHSLATTAYNTRRMECEAGVKIFRMENPDIKSLRDVTEKMLTEKESILDPTIFKRCKFVVKENERVDQTTQALENNDLKAVGELLYASHFGLQNDYEVSCEELDFLVATARNLDYVAGSRMMGGGFGGCTINLVETSQVNSFENEVKMAFKTKYNKEPNIYTVNTADGTSEVEKIGPSHRA